MRIRKYIIHPKKQMILLGATLSLLATSSIAGTGRAQNDSTVPARERALLARAFVLKWGHHARRSHGTSVSTWAGSLIPAFAHGDIQGLRDTLDKSRYDEALAAVRAAIRAKGDEHADFTTRSPMSLATTSATAHKAIGSYTSDLSYTPLQPCRIVDTRVAGGPIGAGQSRAFNALTAPGGSFAAQGGMGHDCQALTTSEASAVALNVTSVGPSFPGYATVFPYGFARPATASLNYTAGGIVNNTVITRIPSPIGSKEFSIFSLASADYVVDIVGYFAPPVSTELWTSTDTASADIPANSAGRVVYPACPSGFVRTSTFCYGAGLTPNVYLMETGPSACVFYNGSAQQQTFAAFRQCIKIPGR